MNRYYLSLAAVLLGIGCVVPSAGAQGILKSHSHSKPVCEPGFKIVEETVIQEVTRTVCKMVPETKKHWVYSTIDDPFCVRDSKHGQCPNCAGPYCRKLLVKTQIDLPCPTLKCVTETIIERVPVTVYRKVPCAIVPETIPVLPLKK